MEQALAQATRPYDAIVMDIVMHRSDGAAVCRTLREKHGVRCPIIAMTANTSSQELQVRAFQRSWQYKLYFSGFLQRYYAMGFDVVLPKPFTKATLCAKLVG